MRSLLPSEDCTLVNEENKNITIVHKIHLSPACPNESFEYTEIELCVDTVR